MLTTMTKQSVKADLMAAHNAANSTADSHQSIAQVEDGGRLHESRGRNDTLGWLCSEVFHWELADRDAVDTATTGAVTDLKTTRFAAGAGALDLCDLLDAEEHADGIGKLGNYIDIAADVDNGAIIHLSSSNRIAYGHHASVAEDRRIRLMNFDLYQQYCIPTVIAQTRSKP